MVAVKIKYLVKKEASKDVFKPASEVVNDIVLKELTYAPCPTLPHLDSLQRTANRFRKKGDYKAVLKAVLSILRSQLKVTKFTLDFEKSAWSAIRQVLPHVKMMGCSFHFTQALWRKVSAIN